MAKANAPKDDGIISVTITEPLTIREKVYAAVRDYITSGRLGSGERVVETRLAQELNTSRTPVREALHMLEREGLLESIPRVGYRLKRITLEEVEEVCEIRVVNETLAAQWAMERMTEENLEAIRENQRKAEQEAAQGNYKSFVHYDGEFHELIARASGSPRLIDLCESLRRPMLLYRVGSIFDQENVLGALKGHQRILTCFEQKDAQKIIRMVREHLDYVKVMVQRYAVRNQK
jgi:DNA-binding GntR family transcriptional regulator